MTSGWILCLAALSQTTWGNPSSGWQPGNTVTAQQPSPTATHPFSSQQAQGGSQFATGQQNNVAVDRYGRPLPGNQSVLTQHNAQNTSSQQAGQHPWQANNAAQQQDNAWGGQNVNANQSTPQQFDTRFTASGQNPSGTATWNGNQQTNNWQQNTAANQSNAPQLIAPQNMPGQQNNWQTQPQYVRDPRTGQLVAAQQGSNASANTNWQTGQQAGNSQWGNQQSGNQQSGGTHPQSHDQFAGNQFSGNNSNPQFDANFNNNGSRFGAQITLGDNRLRVADNSNFNQQNQPHAGGQSSHGQFGGQTNPSLGLQPPLQNTLPQGSDLQGNNQGSLNPHVLAQPPRADDGQQQGSGVTNDPRWANWQVGSTPATNVSGTNGTDTQSSNNAASQNPASQNPASQNTATGNQAANHQTSHNPSGQPNQFGQPQVSTNQVGTTTSADPAAHASQGHQAPTISPPNTSFGNPNSSGGNLFASATNRNGGTQQAGYNQPTSPGMGSNNLFAMAAARNAGNQNQANMNNPANENSSGDNPLQVPFGVSLFANLVMIGAVVYLGWIAFESHFRYRRALIEGDDYGRDDDRDSRRR